MQKEQDMRSGENEKEDLSVTHSSLGAGRNHTPGPWLVSSSFLVCDQEGRIIANSMPMNVPELAIDIHAAVANARLIAVAPELLEALRPFANFACSPPGECDCNNCKARDVISVLEPR